MAERDDLARPGEQRLMVADHVAAAQRREADRAFRPRPGEPVARPHRRVGEVDPPSRRRRLAQHQRGARGRVDLVAVVHLDDLDVVIQPQRRGDLPGQDRQQVEPEAHVARPHDRRVARGRGQHLQVAALQPRRAHHMRQPRLRRQLRMEPGVPRRGEVERRLRDREDLDRIVGHDHAERGPAHRRAEILPRPGVALAHGRPGQMRPRLVQHRLDQHAPHPSGGAEHRDPDRFSPWRLRHPRVPLPEGPWCNLRDPDFQA